MVETADSRRTELTLDANNPAPFVQPFLVLYYENGSVWWIDVGGDVGRYLKDYKLIHEKFRLVQDKLEEKKESPYGRGLPSVLCEPMDWKVQATDLLLQIFAELEQFGHKVLWVTTYDGSAGPSHILRHGAFFRRVDLRKPLEVPLLKMGKFWNLADYTEAIDKAYAELCADL